MKNIKYLRYLIPFLCCIAPDAFAGVFDPPPSDKSIELLGTIFGSNVGTIYLGGGVNPVLSAMFEKLNIVIVSIGVLIVSYIGIVSTINTAQEGQTMGRKWSSIWLPMRSMMGMLLMVPAPGSGYSMIQVTVLWAIMQGVGAADQIWTMVLDYLGEGISATSALELNEGAKTRLEEQGNILAKQILNSAICLESIKKISIGQATDSSGSPIPASIFINKYGSILRLYQTTPTLSTELSAIDHNSTTAAVEYTGYLNIGAKDPSETGDIREAYAEMCGSYKVTGSVTLGELAATGLTGQSLVTEAARRAEESTYKKFLSLNTMFSTLRPIAKKIVDGSVAPRDGERLANAKPSPNGYVVIARDAYRDILSSIIRPTQADSTMQDAIDKGNRAGWIAAGSFYFVLNAAREQTLLATATAPPSSTEYAIDSSIKSVPVCPKDSCGNKISYDDIDSLAGIKDYIINQQERTYIAERLLDGDTYYNNDQTDSRISGSLLDLSEVGGEASKFIYHLQKLNTLAIDLLAKVMSPQRSNGDPILGHAIFGSRLMLAAEITWITIIGVSMAVSLMSISAALNPAFMTFAAILLTTVPVIIVVMGILWLCGAIMAVYMPLIPYMIYTIAALGWFLLVIEAIIAAPIVALGFVIPSGEELGKVVPGLMLLVSIVLRPILMIFGFILAARLYRAIVDLVNFGMADTFSTIPITGSLLAPLAAIALYAVFVIALANKCFALIYIVPDKVLRWIGGPTEQTDASIMQETKQGFEKGTKVVSDTAGEGVAGNIAKDAKERSEQGSGMGGGSSSGDDSGDGPKPPGGGSPPAGGGGGAAGGDAALLVG